MQSPTKVEAVRELMDVVNFDPMSAVSLYKCMCPDCNGSSVINLEASFGLGDPPTIDNPPPAPSKKQVYCETCEGTGAVFMPQFDLAKMTPAYRKNIQDVKFDNKGRMSVSFRNKDKAQTELKVMLGWDRPDALNRHPSGRVLTVDEIEQRDFAMVERVKAMRKEQLVANMLALAEDQLTGASERANIMKTVAQLQGFLTVEGTGLPDVPEFKDFYPTDNAET